MKLMQLLAVILCAIFVSVAADWEGPSTRVVNGRQAQPGQFPSLVHLSITDGVRFFLCSGTLIASNFVLTAAHCAYGVTGANATFGTLNIADSTEQNRQFREITNFYVHPQYDGNEVEYDVAILQFDEAIVLNQYVNIILLPNCSLPNQSFERTVAVFVGYGLILPIIPFGSSGRLYYAEGRVGTKRHCSLYSISGNTTICVFGQLLSSTCQGDSGGPLIATINGKQLQIGITSYGYGGCILWPFFFSDVTLVIQWIYEIIGVLCSQSNTDLLVGTAY